MKTIVALLLISLAAFVASERCVSTSQCDHVQCTDGYQLACILHECTCVDNPSQNCRSRDDCHGRCSRNWHCVDNMCRCF